MVSDQTQVSGNANVASLEKPKTSQMELAQAEEISPPKGRVFLVRKGGEF